MIAYALSVGVIAGLSAIAFRLLIALFHNLLFFGRWDADYNTLLHTAESSWGIAVIAVPVVGALVVAFLVKTFAPEAKGHGVPEVIDAINFNRGFIRPKVALIKTLASSISIGSGGSVGREGPIIQIGATFGSVMAQWMHLSLWQRNTLIAAGAGAGIAATFNTPIGGVLFAVEIMMVEVSARTLVPVMIATATASYIGMLYFGNVASFVIPPLTLGAPVNLSVIDFLSYAILGLIIGVMAVIYTRSIYLLEDWFERLSDNYYIRHALGMLLVGITMYLMMRMFGHYYIQGVGYATIQDILNGRLNNVWILFLLVVVKLLAVSLTLGSGASGGIFSPGLFMGAALGAALAISGNHFYPALAVDPVSSAVIGMACMIGASTGAAVTAIVMILEMTHDYNVVIPLIVAVSLAYAVRRYLMAENIYTLKLARRGHHVPTSLQSNLYLTNKVLDIAQPRYVMLNADASVADLLEQGAAADPHPHVVLLDQERICAVISSETVANVVSGNDPDIPLQQFAEACYCRGSKNMTVVDVFTQLRSERCRIILLMNNSDADDTSDAVAGVLSWADISEAANLPHNMRPVKNNC
ncbi:MAG: chloride channel protein [Mariprofundaceae bacterium]|nr:chloride channel protein [Mariprofundaceae bacterium]